jgi:hypothetical protein
MRTALLFLLLAAGSAHASDNEVAFGSGTRALRSSSADAITGDSLVGVDVELARALPLELPHHLTLWADTDVAWAGATGTMFTVLSTDLFTTLLTAGLHLRYQPSRWVALSAQVAVGAEHASLSITDSTSHVASDGAWGAVARAALKLDVLAVALPRFKFGMRLDAGLIASQGIELVPTEQRTDDPDTLHIPMSEASLGRLNLGGAYLDISFITQF